MRFRKLSDSVEQAISGPGLGILTIALTGPILACLLWMIRIVCKERFNPRLHAPIQTPILNRFSDVRRLDMIRAGEIGDGSADLQDTAIGARAQA